MYKTEISVVEVSEKNLKKVLPDFVLPEGRIISSIDGTANVTWDVEIEGRSWGLKGIYPIVSKVSLTLEVTTSDTDYNEEKVESFDIEIDSTDYDTEGAKLSLRPNTLVYDKNKGWIVEF